MRRRTRSRSKRENKNNNLCLSVGVRKLQVAILVRLSREMCLTVLIYRLTVHLLTRSRLTELGLAIFVYANNTQNLGGTAFARMRASVCVRACVRACVREVFAVYDNNI